MNPQEEAQTASYMSTFLVFVAPPSTAAVADLPYPWWLALVNFALAAWIGNKVYRHVIDDHLRIAYERARKEKK